MENTVCSIEYDLIVEREREKERERESDRERQIETVRGRERETDRDREKHQRFKKLKKIIPNSKKEFAEDSFI